MDPKRAFRHRHKTPIGTERVTRQITDLSILEAAHRFGHQTATALFQIVSPLYVSYRAFLHRVELLRQLENTDYGGPLLYAPSQQVRGAVRPDSNHLVIGIAPRGERLLQNARLWREHRPKTNNKEWKHDFMRNTILSSIFIAAKAGGCKFIYHDELRAELDGKLPFPVPPYKYELEKGGAATRTGATLLPDGFFALRYKDGTKRILIIEADCDTEPGRSDNLERKSYKHNILSYHAFLSDETLRKAYFSDARVGVLNVFSMQHAKESAMEVHRAEIGSEGTYMLYNVWDAFGDFFRPPPPRTGLLHEPWQRVGQPPRHISQAAQGEPQPVLSPLQPAHPDARFSAAREPAHR